ncbi:MAG: hypothetical protein U9R47_09465 [Actinomycetota bacterium]|nr:hypothetical protein [Actinomycetota bacterium]
MPAPKKFKPGPGTTSGGVVDLRPVATKGRYAVATAPIVDDADSVEVVADDMSVVMGGRSKYAQRSSHAYGEIRVVMAEDLELVEATEEAAFVPMPPEGPQFGEWRSESTLDGAHYRRKDSRRL